MFLTALVLLIGTTSATAQGTRPALRSRDPAAVQFMITQEMRASLRRLGYSDADINSLVPERAAAIIDNQIARPSRGVPPSWQRGAGGRRSAKGGGVFGKAVGGVTQLAAFGLATALALHFSGMDLGEASTVIDRVISTLLDSTRSTR